MKPIEIPENFNYIAVFLTFACQFRCSYCINHHGGDLVKGRKMSAEDWINGLNRIRTRKDLPITLQGGEPTVYKHFYQVVNGIKQEIPIDLLTNLEVDTTRFMESISPDRMRRDAPYASIRVSYHHEQSKYHELLSKVILFQKRGYHIGVWEVGHPDYMQDCIGRQQLAQAAGIDWRIKEFLGPWKGVNHGTMRYPDAVNSTNLRGCLCRTSELLISPDGAIFRCHSDAYADRSSIGHILDPDFDGSSLGSWGYCNVYGKCNSCDIKVKTNRFQQGGHSSVEIKSIQDPYAPNQQIEKVSNTYGKA